MKIIEAVKKAVGGHPYLSTVPLWIEQADPVFRHTSIGACVGCEVVEEHITRHADVPSQLQRLAKRMCQMAHKAAQTPMPMPALVRDEDMHVDNPRAPAWVRHPNPARA